MKNFNEINPDSEYLRSILKSITRELEYNFLEKRSRNKNHRSELIEELNDAVMELSSREKDLQAAVGIALMLLDNNDKLLCKILKSKEKLLQETLEKDQLGLEIANLREKIKALEDKNKDINEDLAKAEQIIHKNVRELNRIILEKTKSSDKTAENDLESAKKELNENIESLQFEIQVLEKANRKYTENCSKLETQLKNLSQDYQTLDSKHETASKSLKKAKDQLSKTENELFTLENKYASLESELKLFCSYNKKLKLQVESLEEELSITGSKAASNTAHIHNQSSLHSELSILDIQDDFFYSTQPDESLDDFFIKKPNLSSTRYTSYQSVSRPFTTSTFNHIKIYPRSTSRKPAPEEYFYLTAQVIKMNSSNMENICSIPVKDLYDKVRQENIPFHKWHEWIEKRINEEYINQIFKKKNKKYWTMHAQKKQIISP